MRATVLLAVALQPLSVDASTDRETKWFDRFYGTLGGSLTTFSNNEFGDQSTSFKNVHASIGREFTPKTRLSLDVRHSDSETSTTHAGLPYRIEYGYRSLSLSLNGHRTLWQHGRFSLSGGVGIGIDNGRQRQGYRLDDGQTLFETSHSYKRFQYNINSNMHWSLNDRFTLSMGYRRSWTTLEEGSWSQSMIDFTVRASVKPQRQFWRGRRSPIEHRSNGTVHSL